MRLVDYAAAVARVDPDDVMLLRHSSANVAGLIECGSTVEEYTALQPIGGKYDFLNPDRDPVKVLAVVLDDSLYGIYKIAGALKTGETQTLCTDGYREFDLARGYESRPARLFDLQPYQALGVGDQVEGWNHRAIVTVLRPGKGFISEIEIDLNEVALASIASQTATGLSLRETLKEIQSGWLEYKKGKKVNKTSNVFELVEKTVPSILDSKLGLYDYVTAAGSTGAGLVTAAPWFAVFDSRVTVSATTGFYVVYLYSTDMKQLYLCIGLGSTQFTNQFGDTDLAREKMLTASNRVRTLFSSKFPDAFQGVDVDLKASAKDKMHRKYQNSTVFGLAAYPADDLPQDSELTKDLLFAVLFYQEMVADPLMPTIDELVESAIEAPVAAEIGDSSVSKFQPRKRRTTKAGASPKTGGGPRRSKESAKVGLAGETHVVKWEKAKLVKAGRRDLANKIQEHFANHEFPGWDITSFDIDGNEIYIEVKSSKGKTITSLELTKNEWDAAQVESVRGQYYLYLVTETLSASPKLEVLHDPAGYVERDDLVIEPSVFSLGLYSR